MFISLRQPVTETQIQNFFVFVFLLKKRLSCILIFDFGHYLIQQFHFKVIMMDNLDVVTMLGIYLQSIK